MSAVPPAKLPPPGKPIHWVKTPILNSTLLAHLSLLPRQHAHALFHNSSASIRHKELADTMFVEPPPELQPSERNRIAGSIARRLVSMLKSYEDDVNTLNNLSQDEREDQIVKLISSQPYWLDLHSLLLDHPSAPRLVNLPAAVVPLAAPPPAAEEAHEGPPVAGPIPPHLRNLGQEPQTPARNRLFINLAEDDEEEDENAMQGIEFNPPPQVIPQPQAPAPAAAAFPAYVPPPSPPQGIFHQPFHSSPRGAHHQCLRCDQPLTPSSTSSHNAICFTSATPECFVCGLVYQESFSERDREDHLKRCCESGGSGEGGERRRDESFTFKLTTDNIPKDGNGLPAECSICFIDFEEGEVATRLSCACVFHDSCIRPWWDKMGKVGCTVEH